MSTVVHVVGKVETIVQLSVKDVAQLFQVSEKSIYRWIRDGDLPAYRVNEQYRFNRMDLLEWASAHKVNVAPDAFVAEQADAAAIALSSALEAGGIFYRLAGEDRASALRSVVQIMPIPDDVDREFILQMLLAREAMASTGIGDGIAIPHVRNPIVLPVVSPVVCLCFLEKPVDFDAIDGQPVHSLFALISPTVHSHLQILSRLMFTLRDEGIRKALAGQAPRDEILAAVRAVEARVVPGSGSAPAAGRTP